MYFFNANKTKKKKKIVILRKFSRKNEKNGVTIQQMSTLCFNVPFAKRQTALEENLVGAAPSQP